MTERNITPELDKLFNEIGAYRKSKEFLELFNFMKKFPKIAPYNAMLIHIQKPGSDFVASASVWRKKYYRSIKPGARPLLILQPFGPVGFVFEAGDTLGETPLPVESSFQVKGNLEATAFSKLVSSLICDGIYYHEVAYGTSSAGFTQIDKSVKQEIIVRNKKKIWVKVVFDLVVNKNHDVSTKFATILHELGHIYCGHLGTPEPKWWKGRTGLDLNVREFEAESVCWLVCERMGLKNPSAEYLSGYLGGNDEIPNVSIDTILKAAGLIETMLNGEKRIRKELKIKEENIK